MKRLHSHISVTDMEESIRFYTAVFGVAPQIVMPNYAKWMLDEPSVNFAIFQRGEKVGLSHLHTEVKTGDELSEMQTRLEKAALPFKEQIQQACCYATSDKYWTVDPQGIAWELFNALDSIPTFNKSASNDEASNARCVSSAPAEKCCA